MMIDLTGHEVSNLEDLDFSLIYVQIDQLVSRTDDLVVNLWLEESFELPFYAIENIAEACHDADVLRNNPILSEVMQIIERERRNALRRLG